jgi:aspartate-semialdehyde dehydrogenase
MAQKIIGVVGATGVVGRQVLNALLAHDVEPEDVRFFGSERSTGEELDYGGEVLPVEPTNGPESLRGLAVAILCTPVEVSRQLASKLEQQGTWVIDCSGAFRLDLKVPLVSPGLNDGVLDRAFTGKIVSIAHPATQAALTALDPLREKWGLLMADLTILAGAALFGNAGVDRLAKQTAELMNGKDPDVDTFPHRLAFNVIPGVGEFEQGLSLLERQVLVEGARLWAGEALPALTATALLVPTYHGLTLSVSAHLKRPVEAEVVRAWLKESGELKLLDDPPANVYPMPMLVTDDPAVHVGRVRANRERVQLVIAVDNGVRLASGAVDVALELVER